MTELEIRNSTSEPSAVADGPDGRRYADRAEETYVIDAGAKMMKVLEALEGRNFEPVNIGRVAQRTGFSRDFCRRALITLKKVGWAKQLIPDGRDSLFVLGPKAENLARRYGAAMVADPQLADRARL
jgi:DNA-binding IclR family transcriptional regulator